MLHHHHHHHHHQDAALPISAGIIIININLVANKGVSLSSSSSSSSSSHHLRHQHHQQCDTTLPSPALTHSLSLWPATSTDRLGKKLSVWKPSLLMKLEAWSFERKNVLSLTSTTRQHIWTEHSATQPPVFHDKYKRTLWENLLVGIVRNRTEWVDFSLVCSELSLHCSELG